MTSFTGTRKQGFSPSPKPERGRHPCWESAEGLFLPIPLAFNPAVAALKPLFQDRDFPSDSSLFVRGSIVEEGAPHPCADLDLIVIAPQKRWLIIEALLSEVLSAQPWLVDVQPHTLDSASSCLPSRLLLHTRSLLLCG